MKRSEATIHRNRRIYALAVIVVVGIGLLLRSGSLPLPHLVVKYGGDSLWALVVFLGVGFIFRHCPTMWTGFIALIFAWSIEFLQLYHADWIDQIRATRLGRLVLGSTFNSPDLMAYAVGIALGVLAERTLERRNKCPSPSVIFSSNLKTNCDLPSTFGETR